MKLLALVLITASNLYASGSSCLSLDSEDVVKKQNIPQVPFEDDFEVLEKKTVFEDDFEVLKKEDEDVFEVLEENPNSTSTAIVPYGFGRNFFGNEENKNEEEKTENRISVSFCEKGVLLGLGNREDIVPYVTFTKYPWLDLRRLHLTDSMLPSYPPQIHITKRECPFEDSYLGSPTKKAKIEKKQEKLAMKQFKNLLCLENEPENKEEIKPKNQNVKDYINSLTLDINKELNRAFGSIGYSEKNMSKLKNPEKFWKIIEKIINEDIEKCRQDMSKKQ